MDQKTDFLVPASSFLIGIGSLLNLSGNYFDYNQSRTTAQADQRALSNDWAMVGQDIRRAMDQVENDVGRVVSPDVHGQE
jgi:hypothetical protein